MDFSWVLPKEKKLAVSSDLYLMTTYSYVGLVIWLVFDTQLEAFFVSCSQLWKSCGTLGPFLHLLGLTFLSSLYLMPCFFFSNGQCKEMSKRSDINRPSPTPSASSGVGPCNLDKLIFPCVWLSCCSSILILFINSDCWHSGCYPSKHVHLMLVENDLWTTAGQIVNDNQLYLSLSTLGWQPFCANDWNWSQTQPYFPTIYKASLPTLLSLFCLTTIIQGYHAYFFTSHHAHPMNACTAFHHRTT